jgi:prepilin-type N-terminal cleavage/methylation domain-containing protein
MPVTARRLLRGDGGFTLPELLIGMTLALLIMSAALTLIEDTSRVSARTQARVDATQRGRLATELMTRDLRSQVCLGPVTPPIAVGDNSTITFYANTGTVDLLPRKYRISLTGSNIIEETFVGTGTAPTITWPATATTTRTLLTNVQGVPGVPFLRYFAFTQTAPIVPTLLLATPLSTNDAAKTVQVSLAFTALPDPKLGQPKPAISFDNDVYVRAANPTDPSHGPLC